MTAVKTDTETILLRIRIKPRVPKARNVIITLADENMSEQCRKCNGSYPFHMCGCPLDLINAGGQ